MMLKNYKQFCQLLLYFLLTCNLLINLAKAEGISEEEAQIILKRKEEAGSFWEEDNNTLPPASPSLPSVSEEPELAADEKEEIIEPQDNLKEEQEQITKLKDKITEQYLEQNYAEIIILNKITAKSDPIKLAILAKENRFFGNLSIEVERCLTSKDPYKISNLMFVTIYDNKIEEDRKMLFQGWLLAENPSIANFEHPIYEIIPVRCLGTEK